MILLALEDAVAAAATNQHRGFGVAQSPTGRYWYKFGSQDEMRREQSGYGLLREYYRTPQLLQVIPLSHDRAALVFEYLPAVTEDAGLLADNLATVGATKSAFMPFAEELSHVFRATFAIRPEGASSDYFFRDRVQPRLCGYYDDTFLREYSGHYVVNGRTLSLDLPSVKQGLLRHFATPRQMPSVLGQCDLNDRNITTAGELLDYVAGGYNPLMAEWATLYVYQLVIGPVIAPALQASIYRGSAEHHLEVAGRTVTYEPGAPRRWLARHFYERVVRDLVDGTAYPEALEHFKMYAAMRLLTIFDIRTCSEPHRVLVLGLLARVQSAQTFEELHANIH